MPACSKRDYRLCVRVTPARDFRYTMPRELTNLSSYRTLIARSRGDWLLRFLAGGRILAFPSKLKRLWSLDLLKPYLCGQEKRDTFFYLTHEFYLSKCFTLAQRIDCAVTHYSFERQNCGAAYHRAVYRSVRGLALWQRTVEGTHYAITLRATEDLRYEGDLSVLCWVDDVRVSRISFSYVPGSLFALPQQRIIFVTRNQTDRNAQLQLFRSAFRHNSPPYFCLAAIWGIAMANGMRDLLMIKEVAQIAYSDRYAVGFRNSYSAFWEGLGAREIPNRNAYHLSIPLSLTPVSHVKHKNRAIARRHNWLEIATSARRAILENRTDTVPAAIADEPGALLPRD